MNLEQSNPLVTVYIPTFNRVELLKRAVESVRQQTYQNLEIIIVDDCSTDGTHEYLKDISNKDSRIRFFLKEKNSGACVSRNIAIERANGEFITGLDDDDYFTTNRIEKFLKNWKEKEGLKGLFSETAIRKNNTLKCFKYRRLTYKKKVSASDLIKNNYVGNQIFTKLEILRKNGGFDADFKMWQDLECWYSILKSGGYFKGINGFTYVQDVSHDYGRITQAKKDKLDETYNVFLDKHNLESRDRIYLKSHYYNYGYNETTLVEYLFKFFNGFHWIDLIRIVKIILRKNKR